MKNNSAKTYIFFDLTDYSLLRFPEWISAEILVLDSDAKFIFTYLYNYTGNTDLSSIESRGEVISLGGNIRAIDSILLRNTDRSVLFTFAMRPPEFYINARAREIGVPSRLVQHGIFIPFMKKTVSYFFSETKKLYYYAKSVYALAGMTDLSAFSLFKDVVEIYIFGKKKISDSAFAAKGDIVDEVYVYSAYWLEYFSQNYGCSRDSCVEVGAPDLAGFDAQFDQPKEDAVCYICQTLVEDGRLPEHVFLKFVDSFCKSLEETDRLYLKLHPRTNIALYELLTRRENTVVCSDSMPYCEKYVGHYSTLLARSLFVTGNVFLWEFDGHPIPEYFEQSASDIASSSDRLLQFLRCKERIQPKVDILTYYFNSPGRMTFKEIASRNV